MYMKLNKMIQDVGVLNNDELNKVVEAVKLRRNQLHFQDAHNLKFNDRVSFQGRHGMTETGTVEKVKIKYVLVRTCLLYTSPSPRDQRGSGMPWCA